MRRKLVVDCEQCGGTEPSAAHDFVVFHCLSFCSPDCHDDYRRRRRGAPRGTARRRRTRDRRRRDAPPQGRAEAQARPRGLTGLTQQRAPAAAFAPRAPAGLLRLDDRGRRLRHDGDGRQCAHLVLAALPGGAERVRVRSRRGCRHLLVRLLRPGLRRAVRRPADGPSRSDPGGRGRRRDDRLGLGWRRSRASRGRST